MRSVRYLLAAVALFGAAACTAPDSLTAPQSPPAARHDLGDPVLGGDGVMSGGGTGGIGVDSTAAAPGGGNRGGFIGSDA
jgi:hypothetical protein